jgi:hypothetical protein
MEQRAIGKFSWPASRQSKPTTLSAEVLLILAPPGNLWRLSAYTWRRSGTYSLVASPASRQISYGQNSTSPQLHIWIVGFMRASNLCCGAYLWTDGLTRKISIVPFHANSLWGDGLHSSLAAASILNLLWDQPLSLVFFTRNTPLTLPEFPLNQPTARSDRRNWFMLFVVSA